MYPLGHVGIALAVGVLLERFALRGRPLDYRLLVVGALLPDLIDKPLALTGLVGGRSIAHTLLFALVLTSVVGADRSRRGSSARLLVLALGVFVHLALDLVWAEPALLLWPALGLAFPADGVGLGDLLRELLEDPFSWGGEIVGGVLIVAFVVGRGLTTREAWRRLVREGVAG